MILFDRRVAARMLAAAALLLALLAGCKKTRGKVEERSEKDSGSLVLKADFPFRFPAVERVVAIGDLHGDLSATRRALRLAGALDEGDTWIGGKLVVVQTGDQIDRADDDRAVLDLFETLRVQASAAGGAVHSLNGNHETINVAGDFRYVTPAGFLSFTDVDPGEVPPQALERFGKKERGRAAAFLPRGRYAELLSRRNVVAIVGETVFVHGGILPQHVEYGIERINAETSHWMRGEFKQPAIIDRADSPVWTRDYGAPSVPELACKALQKVLSALEAKRLVVGHTTQKAGISAACSEKVWRIDVGMSSYYGERPAEVLELRGDSVRAIVDSAVAAEARDGGVSDAAVAPAPFVIDAAVTKPELKDAAGK